MTLAVVLLSSFGLGFAIHFDVPVLELVCGPVLILIGDREAIDGWFDDA